MIRVAGLDLSLTATGWAVAHVDEAGWYANAGVVKSAAPPRQPASRYRLQQRRRLDEWMVPAWVQAERLNALQEGILAAVGTGNALVVIEGPSYGSVGGLANERAGLYWLVATAFSAWGQPFAVVSPKARAKYATGDGAAGKSSVRAATLATYQLSEAHDDNACDAMLLAAMGCRYLRLPLEDELPEENQRGMLSPLWPALKGEW